MSKPHIADAESAPFVIVNITPDFCLVDGDVIAFDIVQELVSERVAYAETVLARGNRTLTLGSVIKAVKGDAGEGVLTGTSTGAGHNLVIEGDPTVKIE